MRKFVSFVLILFLNVPYIRADNNLEQLQDASSAKIENLWSAVDKALTKIENTTNNTEIKQKIQDKKEEIEVLVEKTTDQIDKTANVWKIDEIKTEAIKRIELKTYSSITDYDSVKEGIKETNPTELKNAVNAVIESVKEDTGYKVFLKTTSSVTDFTAELQKYDEKLQVLSDMNIEWVNYIELIISKDSILRQELFEDIDTGVFPDKIKKFEVIKPVAIKSEGMLSWEDTGKLWNMSKIWADKYQQKLSSSRKIKVWVIDTGIDYNHTDLRWNFGQNKWYDFVNNDNYPMDDHYHGTHVAGTVWATVNGNGIYGVDANVELVWLKALNAKWIGSSYDIYKAIMYAADNGIPVINMSIGWYGDPNNDITCKAIDYALSKWTISVVAAWNEDDNANYFVPAGCKNTITVGAVDSSLYRATFSNYGTKVDISAPGVWIYSTTPNGVYKTLNGTSMATPHVTGLVAAILANRNYTLNEVKKILKDNSDTINASYGKPVWNMIDMKKVMTSLWVSEDGGADKPNTNPIPAPNPPSDTICNSNQHKEWNACVSNNKACSIWNGTWEQMWNTNGWGACVVKSCNDWYENQGNSCVVKIKPLTCNPDQHTENNSCVSNSRTCSVSNWVGGQTWNWNSWWGCTVSSCNTWYDLSNGSCIVVENPVGNTNKYPWCNTDDIKIWNQTWAACNAWATNPQEAGNYYMWWKNTPYSSVSIPWVWDWTKLDKWPCADWYHVPTSNEWKSALQESSWSWTNLKSKLSLNLSWYYSDWKFTWKWDNWYYWTGFPAFWADVENRAYAIFFSSSYNSNDEYKYIDLWWSEPKTMWFSVRCIKD